MAGSRVGEGDEVVRIRYGPRVGSDDVRSQLESAGVPRGDAARTLGQVKSLVDEARGILNGAMRGSTNKLIESARAEMDKAESSAEAALERIRGIDDKFDEFMEYL